MPFDVGPTRGGAGDEEGTGRAAAASPLDLSSKTDAQLRRSRAASIALACVCPAVLAVGITLMAVGSSNGVVLLGIVLVLVSAANLIVAVGSLWGVVGEQRGRRFQRIAMEARGDGSPKGDE